LEATITTYAEAALGPLELGLSNFRGLVQHSPYRAEVEQAATMAETPNPFEQARAPCTGRELGY
jgi:hypothetical protein